MENLSQKDMYKFWTTSIREKFISFKNWPIVPSRVINLQQLKESQWKINPPFKAYDLLLLFHPYGLEVFEDPICMFYANLKIFEDSGELETLVLGTRIILNNFLFEKVFDTKFFGMVPCTNKTWSENFEVNFWGC